MRLSLRFVLFVSLLAVLTATVVSGRFSWLPIVYFATGVLWFLHVKTLPFKWQTGGFALTENRLVGILMSVVVWPIAAGSAAQDRLRRTFSPKRFLVSQNNEIKRFRHWQDALECARLETSETKTRAAIQDTSRYEWRAPWYDISSSSGPGRDLWGYPLYFVEPSGGFSKVRWHKR